MRFINKILGIDNYSELDLREINRLTVMNIFYSLCFILGHLYAFVYVANGKYLAAIVMTVASLIFGSVVYFNRKKWYDTANVVGFISTGLGVFVVSYIEGLTKGYILYYILTPLMTIVFLRTFKPLTFFITLVFYGFLLFLILAFAYIENDVVSEEIFNPVLLINFLLCFLFVFFFSFNLRQVNDRFFDDITEKNDSLKKKEK